MIDQEKLMHVTMRAMTKTITAISTKGYVIVCQDMPKTQMVTADVLKVSVVKILFAKTDHKSPLLLFYHS